MQNYTKRIFALCLTTLATLCVWAQDVQEKELYATDFTEWTAASANEKSETQVNVRTKYSKENLTFKILGTQISPTNGNTAKFPDWKGGYLCANKSSVPYVETSALASVTKVKFKHGATGSKRGWKLEAKGDGDNTWVTLSDSYANPAAGCDVEVEVNRTNCTLRFTNLTTNQNAYLFQLNIYGKVDMSQQPLLGSFTANGVTYEADKLFEEQKDGTMAATIELPKAEAMISESNPLANLTATNGTLGTVSYAAASNQTVATIPVSKCDNIVNYKVTFTWKPNFTLTYYNTDGTVYGKAIVEKGNPIGTLKAYETELPTSKQFRGWFEETDGGRKYTTADVVNGNLKLYAIVTRKEMAETFNRMNYVLTNPYFYAEDHEGFDPTNGSYHDGTHGWSFSQGGTVKLLVSKHAYISLGLCAYSSESDITATDDNGFTATIAAKAASDGKSASLEYSGNGGTLTLTFGGTTYLHNICVVNDENSTIQPNAQGYYVVEAGNADHLLATLAVAQSKSQGDRTTLFLPNGTYDLGKTVLTPIYANNISIIGQSMDGTIIKNAPDVKDEGISVTATLLVTGKGTYLQDLTLQNALDYYGSNGTGRAVCLQDKGTQTICKNVKMLSYQDTYYSNTNSGKFYWEDSEIHGTVDYLCGGGDAFFNRCTLVNEKRNANGTGGCTIAAPAGNTEWGYVLDHCTIDCPAENFNYGRAWNNKPRLAYLNTTLLQPSKLASSRFTTGGMNVPADKFVEYNTMDKTGKVISPASKVIKFTKDKTTNEMETILTADQAKAYTIDNVLGTDWQPTTLTAQTAVTGVKQANGTLTWESEGGRGVYAIFADGAFVAMTADKTFATEEGKTYTVRAANAMGGFGTQASATAISHTTAHAAVVKTEYILANGIRASKPQPGVNIRVVTLTDGTQKTDKIVVND